MQSEQAMTPAVSNFEFADNIPRKVRPPIHVGVISKDVALMPPQKYLNNECSFFTYTFRSDLTVDRSIAPRFRTEPSGVIDTTS